MLFVSGLVPAMGTPHQRYPFPLSDRMLIRGIFGRVGNLVFSAPYFSISQT